MSTTDWAQFILTLLSIGAILISSIRWYIKVQVRPIAEAVEDIRKETKTNGGSSMRDEIKDLKKDSLEAKKVREEQKEKIDHIYDLFVEYVSRPR
jgi:uncharacterized protein (UPF0305 family)